MPYSEITELPENIQKLPEAKQKQWMNVFNSAYERAKKDGKDDKDAESFAFANANGVVLKKEANEPQIYIALKETNFKEIKLLYPGEFKHTLYGEFKVTEKDIDQAIENWNNKIATRLDESGKSELPMNYQHAGHDKNPEIAKASGWIKGLVKKGKELWAKIDWTDKAKEFIKNKEFKYISPEFHKNWEDETGKKCGFTILGAALTNVNFLKKGMPALALDDGDYIYFGDLEITIDQEKLRRSFDSIIWPFQQLVQEQIRDNKIKKIDDLIKYVQKTMQDIPKVIKDKYNELNNPELNEPKERSIMELTEQLIEILNLKEGDDIVESVKKLTENNAEFEKKVQNQNTEIEGLNSKIKEQETKIQDFEKKLTDQDDDQTVSLKEFNELTETVKKLTEDNTKLNNTIQLREAEKVIEGYVYNSKTGKGKILPKNKPEWVKLYLADNEGIKAMLENMPDVISFEEQGSDGKGREIDNDPSIEITKRAKELMSKDQNLSLQEAHKQVLEEDSELAEAYEKARRGE